MDGILYSLRVKCARKAIVLFQAKGGFMAIGISLRNDLKVILATCHNSDALINALDTAENGAQIAAAWAQILGAILEKYPTSTIDLAANDKIKPVYEALIRVIKACATQEYLESEYIELLDKDLVFNLAKLHLLMINYHSIYGNINDDLSLCLKWHKKTHTYFYTHGLKGTLLYAKLLQCHGRDLALKAKCQRNKYFPDVCLKKFTCAIEIYESHEHTLENSLELQNIHFMRANIQMRATLNDIRNNIGVRADHEQVCNEVAKLLDLLEPLVVGNKRLKAGCLLLRAYIAACNEEYDVALEAIHGAIQEKFPRSASDENLLFEEERIIKRSSPPSSPILTLYCNNKAVMPDHDCKTGTEGASIEVSPYSVKEDKDNTLDDKSPGSVCDSFTMGCKIL